MSILFCPYTLRSRGSLNAVSQRSEFHGALIKVDEGIGCLHPWPEFGDAPVEEQLDLLREGGTSKVIERAMHMAVADGAARENGVSLFAGLEIPPSHYSWDQHQPPEPQMQRLIGEGWKAIKTKGSLDLNNTLRSLNALASLAGDAPLKFRVDFNSCLTGEQFEYYLERMPLSVRLRLDFVEDPFSYDAELWSNFQSGHAVRLALDKQLRGATRGFDVAVIKPGRREWREMTTDLPPSARVVMTSAMDHAIGQSFAAYEAALAWRELGSRMDLCGLCTEHLFEEDPFLERIRSHGGNLEVDRTGTGLGFDDVLAGVPWKEL